MWTGRRRATRRFLAASVAALAVPALIVGWLGLELIRLDQDRDQQRVVDRLTPAADLTVSALDRALADTDRQLAEFLGSGNLDPAAAALRLGATGADAALLVITAADITSSTPLLYYPQEPEFVDQTADVFAWQEHLEFIDNNLPAALASYREAARSREPGVRAGSKARAARVAAKLNQPQVALQLYRELGEEGSTMTLGLPADLVAGFARSSLLAASADRHELAAEAARLNQRLLNADWRLSRSQFHFYRQQVADWLGAEHVTDPDNRSLRETIAAGAFEAWRRSADIRTSARQEVSGRDSVETGASPAIVMWHYANGTVAALVGTTRYADRVWFPAIRAVEKDYHARVSLVAPSGAVWYGALTEEAAIPRAASDTRLPFTVRVATSDPAGDAALSRDRRWLLGGVVASLALIVLVGGYVTARGLARELAVARLQSDFVAAVSHEFRTPVASVRQLTELLDEGRITDESRRVEYYGLLRREGVRLQRLVENLLDFGRMESAAAEYRFEPLDLETALQEIAHDFNEELRYGGRRVNLAISPLPPLPRGDREALTRAVWNLLDNAVKYSPEGTPIVLAAHASATTVDVSVHDEGPGIPLDEQQQIFQKFVRGARARASGSKGTGLGLAMVKHIVEAHHGTVRVDSRPGTGTTFTIHIPMQVTS